MEKAIRERIEKWKKDNPAGEGKEATNEDAFEGMKELILDGKKFPVVKAEDTELLKKFKNLSRLSLNQTGLQNLDNFPKLETLHILELTDNHLNSVDILKHLVEHFPNVKTLEIGGNHFKNLKDFEVLKGLKKLERLGVQFNPCAEDTSYRKTLFECLSNVKIIDCFNREGEEVVSSDDDEEDEEDEEVDTTLKKFYEADFKEEEDEEDEEFVPNEQEADEDDDEIDEDLEEEEIEELDKDDIEIELAAEAAKKGEVDDKSHKRKQDAVDSANEVDTKKTKVE